MGLDADAYRDMLVQLQPPGQALPTDLDSLWVTLLTIEALELTRVDARVEDLLRESDPRTATEMVEDWERAFGLPGVCAAAAPSALVERRAAVLSHLRALYGQRAADYVALAESLGYEGATVDRFRPFRAGQAMAGAPLSNGDWIHAVRLRVAAVSIRPFAAGAGCAGESLATWGDEFWECKVRERALAHVIYIFSYGEEE